MTTTVITAETTEDQRWTAWKQSGRVSELRRKGRMRKLFAAVCFGGVIWLLSGLF